MSRMWVRVYADILDDQKISQMSPKTFKFFIFLLVLCAEEGSDDKILTSKRSLCWRFRVTQKACNAALKELEENNIISFENNILTIKNWHKRQYKSDSSTERVKRFRNKNETLHATPPEQKQNRNRTETEPETDARARAREAPYEIAAEKFVSEYPVQKNHKRAIEEFIAYCHNHDFDKKQTDDFVCACLFSLQNQKEEKKKLGEYNLPVPEWKHPDKWLAGECWKDKIETAENIRRRAVKMGRWNPPTEEYFDNTIVEEVKKNGYPVP